MILESEPMNIQVGKVKFTSKNKHHLELISNKLEDIKKNLNPEFSFFVFEITGKSLTKKDHLSIIEELNRVAIDFIEWEFHSDEITEENLFVIKLDPDNYHDYISKMINLRLPQYIRHYIYDRQILKTP
jgi:hypothetical protein